MLALDSHLMSGEPDERIEPENRDCDLSRELRESVESFHVRHFVDQNETSSLFRPFFGVRRKKDRGINDSPRHGNTEPVSVQQSERTIDA
jgi:hypothetical protein